jgi:hypothetical protein
MPSYQAFNRRLNELVVSFEHLIGNTLLLASNNSRLLPTA